jgi:hypothetical protein
LHHRNHITVMTADRHEFADFAAEATNINLSGSISAIYGNGIKYLNGVYAMYAGDVTSDDFIGNDDMNTWATSFASTGYNNADIDMDGLVGQTDMLIWAVNWTKAGSVPGNSRAIDGSFSSHGNVVNQKQVDIHYGMTSPELVEYDDGEVYYEFDIIASSDKVSRFLSGQLFLGYNSDVFGSVVNETGNLFVTGSNLVTNEIDVPGPSPAINAYAVMTADFGKNILAVGSVWNPAAVSMMSYENANLITQNGQDYLHIALKCNVIPEAEENLVWFVESELLANQQTYFDHDNNWHAFAGIAYDAIEPGTPVPEPQTAISSAIKGVYPNPFNPTTTLYFEIDEAAPVSLAIYNIRGQKVRSFDLGQLPSGSHNVTWNGASDSGAHCGSGVYFLKLVTGSRTDMTRVLMLK